MFLNLVSPLNSHYAQYDFRVFLQNEFSRRNKINARYSLRSFARQLQIESSSLSKILNGKRNMSPEMIEQLGDALKLKKHQLNTYKRYQKLILDNQFDVNYSKYEQLDSQTFPLIATWYHYAILALVTTHNFQSNPEWISKRLGVSKKKVNHAIHQLIKSGYIVITEEGHWKLRTHFTNAKFTNTDHARKNLQKEILILALKSLDHTQFENRDQSSMTMAIRKDKLPLAKERIKKFRRELSEYLNEGDGKQEVYNLSISLYPVTIEE